MKQVVSVVREIIDRTRITINLLKKKNERQDSFLAQTPTISTSMPKDYEPTNEGFNNWQFNMSNLRVSLWRTR